MGITFQVAGGIIIAAVVLGLTAFGFSIAWDKDLRTFGENQPGWWIGAVGISCAIFILYMALG